jgi:hypothetical protein
MEQFPSFRVELPPIPTISALILQPEISMSNGAVSLKPRDDTHALSNDNLRADWAKSFAEVRAETERRAAPLSPEDQVVQSMPDASDQMASRTRRGSSNNFCWCRMFSAIGCSTNASRICSTLITSLRGRHAC